MHLWLLQILVFYDASETQTNILLGPNVFIYPNITSSPFWKNMIQERKYLKSRKCKRRKSLSELITIKKEPF